MKNNLLIAVHCLLLLIIGTTCDQSNIINELTDTNTIISEHNQAYDDKQTKEVKARLNNLTRSIKTTDINLFSKTVAHDSEMISFGTDVNEHFIGYEALKKSMEDQFSSYEHCNVSVTSRVVTVHDSGLVAWYAETADWQIISNGKMFEIKNLRSTGVLEKRDETWYVVQYHVSLPVSGQMIEYDKKQ